jgi:hypothetical protein
MSSRLPSCVECDLPAAIGSKCGLCYVRTHAKRRGLWKKKWFQFRLKFFVAALVGRFWAIEQGQSPGDIEALVYQVARDECHRAVNADKVREIISAADKLAEGRRRRNEESRDCSEEA